ncbi:hypothetical protein RFI_10820 [Reticulomyxa filosa]|uniref:ADP-ribosylation/Crystallin J1 n=1 Tax=Reticulomyxa filosa TaxID=46433 RepID=X6NKQ5_RETFI|nr:hypothetical protein RFI_10820 [Reticulomyxa filosa]|eukprot:ETO26314.1 hypothetical protein RFI_10820 [Reticulomyxa filosa]
MKKSKQYEPGQVTEKTHMAMHLAQGLVRMIQWFDQKKLKNYVSMDPVISEYKDWCNRFPSAKDSLYAHTIAAKKSIDDIRHQAYQVNAKNEPKVSSKSSKSPTNGTLTNDCLLRCVPLIIYDMQIILFEFKKKKKGIRLQPDETFNLMRLENSLTHANFKVYYTMTMYALTVQYLIRQPAKMERNRLAIEFALQFLKNKQIQARKDNPSTTSSINEVERWLMDAVKAADADLASAKDAAAKNSNNNNNNNANAILPSPSFARAAEFGDHIQVAFQRAFYHLQRGDPFELAIQSTLHAGGNVSGNCCVVGALLGAYWGFSSLDKWHSKIGEWESASSSSSSSSSSSKSSVRIFPIKNYSKLLEFLFHRALNPNPTKIKLEDNKKNHSNEDEFVLVQPSSSD